MADGPALALQKALIAALKADAGVAAIVGARVYDEPPQPVAFPYVRLGVVELIPFRSTCAPKGWTTIFPVEVYSRPNAGRGEASQLAHAVATALDDAEASITVTGFTLEWIYVLTQVVDRAEDGKTYEGRVAFEASLSA